ncbi:hypothetical protein MBRU_16155 [Mycolicibacterium brumae DSM 44177]|nr:hypothetical protein MBRU_16155 [Mycolicibacterium brumae DSM 44177]
MLLRAAYTPGAVIYQSSLVNMLEQAGDDRPSMTALLKAVADECSSRGEPLLPALCVDGDRPCGAFIAWLRDNRQVPASEAGQVAASERRKCYQSFGNAQSWGDPNGDEPRTPAQHGGASERRFQKRLWRQFWEREELDKRIAAEGVVLCGARVTVSFGGAPEETEAVVYRLEKLPDDGPEIVTDKQPLGAAIEGARVGQVVTAKLPAGTRRIRILSVEPASARDMAP